MRVLMVLVAMGLGVAGQTPLGKPMAPREDSEGMVAKADAALALDMKDPEKRLAAGIARDRVWKYNDAIEVYGKGMELFPKDWRFPRYRGHRYLSTRQFGKATADLELARKLAPQSFDVAYHLGLAYYLRGQFDKAAAEYRRCLNQAGKTDTAPLVPKARTCAELSTDADSRVAVVEWLYRSLRRAKQDAEAEKLLESIPEELETKENEAYFDSLLLYKGLRTEKSIMDPSKMDGNRFPTVGYAVANYHLLEGNTRKACELLKRIVEHIAWNAFGYIAAETELVRGACKDE